jgi:aldose 1-epimerase
MGDMRPVSGEQWTIASGDQRAVIVEVGGGLRTYQVGDWDVLHGYAEDEIAPGGAGQVLAPWPNRLGDGQYTYRGQSYTLALSEPARRNAAHGLVRWLPWQATQHTADSVQVGCLLPAHPGYPWTLRLTITWSIGPDGLRAEHTATNLSAQPGPFGLGLHPYLRLPDSTVDETIITLSARTQLLVDDRRLPTERVAVAVAAHDFAAGRPIGATRLDTAFTDLAPGDNAVTLSSPTGEHAVRVWGDDSFRWWQLFTGDTLPDARRRRAVAIEPMTCPPDAFRSGTDLITLEPGETWRAAWGVTPTRA